MLISIKPGDQSIISTEYDTSIRKPPSTLSFLNSFPNDEILDSSKLKEFADDNFEFDEKGRKFSKRVENTAGKGEIARSEQFLLFPQCFQKTGVTTRKNKGLFGKGLTHLQQKTKFLTSP